MTKLRIERLQNILCLVAALTTLLLAQLAAHAQTDQGRIVGTVADANGALVVGANVSVRNERTGDERTATTNVEGTFSVPALKASSYTVTVTGKDFAPSKVTDVQLNVGQELTLNIILKTSAVTASVDVVAASESATDTGSASISATVNQREVVGLPNNGRQLSQLYLQAPGSQNSGSGTFGDIRFSGRRRHRSDRNH